ncbi:MAG: pilus (MSHA type) biogenesis protein MshL [Magnetococcales bacterium]|nr:pilus (MSHA type) biogenesis protein MshL [Magnetococcales bacterium]
MMPIQVLKYLMTPSAWKGRYRGGWLLGVLLGGVLIASCQSTDIKSSKSHFLRPTDPPVHITAGADIAPEEVVAAKDGVEPGSHNEVYTITVTEMPVRDLLFALARDANKNIDVYPGITGRVTLSAIDQTLPQILDRVAKQVGIRYEIDGETVIVSPDRPYLKIYQVDYINLRRDAVSGNKVSTQLSTSTLANPDMTESDANQSSTSISTQSSNRFWYVLTQNIQSIIGNERTGGTTEMGATAVPGLSAASSGVIPAAGDGGLNAIVPPDGGAGAAEGSNMSVVGSDGVGIVAINPEAGIISVYATSTQHERIQRYLDTVLDNVHRQVLIESTVVEVELSDGFQEGVDWNKAFNPAGIAVKGVFSQMNPVNAPLDFFTIQRNGGADGATVTAALKALEAFGTTKVLSSPKIMALNNQPALLKVVKNEVFFTMESSTTTPATSSTTTASTATAQIPVFNTKIHTVPVGLIMSVTPQISDKDIVSLNVRPTISRIYNWKNDPNPALQRNTLTTGLEEAVISKIPEIEVKEMETMMRVHSGQVAVMGGLMQDESSEKTNGIPVLGRLPGLGFLFGNQARTTRKTELVIFLRPVVMSQGKPRDLSGQEGRKPQSTVQVVKPAAKPPAKPAPAKDGALPETGTTPGGKGDEVVPPLDPAGTQNEVPAPAAALAPGGSYLDFTAPGGVVNVGGAAPSHPPAAAAGNPAGLTQNAETHIAPPPAQPALPPEVEDDSFSLPMDTSDRQSYGGPSAMNQGSGRAGGASQGNVYLELGSFRQQVLADNVQAQVNAIGLPISREQAMVAGTPYQRVRSGPYNNREEANQAKERISSLTGIQAKLTAK